jgi:hypothetical protein
MNFTFTWIMDKLGFMPKIDMEIGKVKIDTQSPEFRMFPFPVEQEKPKKQGKKTTTRKPAVKKPVAKKATTVAKKAK